jgi:hypothetical protein
MAESADYTPAPYWKGHDFTAARNAYDAHVGRSYSEAVTAGKDAKQLVPANITSKSTAPVVIAIDVTGSMGEWPKTIFSKLPYLEHELKEYLGDDAEISFCAIGDVYTDQYALQVRPFVKGADLATELKELVIEGGGGGQTNESYDMGAYYYARHCEVPNAQKPVFIFIGDEGLYEHVAPDAAKKFCDDTLKSTVTTHKVIGELKRKFSVYCIRKPYDVGLGDSMSALDHRLSAQWQKLLGDDKVKNLPDPNRVVDVIFGILAEETGREDYFEQELKDRQLKDKDGDVKVSVVMKALNTSHKLPKKSLKKLPGPAAASASVTRHRDDDGKDSISLLD